MKNNLYEGIRTSLHILKTPHIIEDAFEFAVINFRFIIEWIKLLSKNKIF